LVYHIIKPKLSILFLKVKGKKKKREGIGKREYWKDGKLEWEKGEDGKMEKWKNGRVEWVKGKMEVWKIGKWKKGKPHSTGPACRGEAFTVG
jgi:hypothetical protein